MFPLIPNRPLIRLSELVEREDLFTTSNLKSSIRLAKRGDDAVNGAPSSDGEDKSSPEEVEGPNEANEEQSNGMDNQVLPGNQRIHYSESTSDVPIPSHILQLAFADKNKFDESKVRSFAASNLNAEFRVDSQNALLLFQSCKAAKKALESNPFKEKFNATLEHWAPRFFPTSMF